MPTFADFLKELFEEATQGLPGVITRPYFGGTGMYRGGAIFALVSREPRLYLRLPDAGRLPAFLEAAGPEQEAQEFTNVDIAVDWLKNHRKEIVTGTLIVIAGVAFVAAVAGSGGGVLCLVPLLAMASIEPPSGLPAAPRVAEVLNANP